MPYIPGVIYTCAVQSRHFVNRDVVPSQKAMYPSGVCLALGDWRSRGGLLWGSGPPESVSLRKRESMPMPSILRLSHVMELGGEGVLSEDGAW